MQIELNAQNKYLSFQNPEVILVTYDDPRVAVMNDAQCRFEQEEFTPTYLVIRPKATDEQLIKVAGLFNLDLNDLKKFRAEVAK
jgi:hypothetical protein